MSDPPLDAAPDPNADPRLARVARRLEPAGRLLRAWPLAGGVSAQVTALEIARPDGGARRVVVRRHGAVDLQQNPRVAATEFAVLRVVHAAGLAAPAPLDLDESGAIFPAPYLVVEYVEGSPDLAPAAVSGGVAQLAGYLARLHALNTAGLDRALLPRQYARLARLLREAPALPDESLDEGRIRAALAAAWPPPPPAAPALLHGDFWPGNALWRDGRLAAILDWEDAALGDPLADLANARLEILWASGAGAMRAFTAAYHAQTGADLAGLPYWDLCAALRPAGKLAGWGLAPATEAAMRAAHHEFTTHALAALIPP